MMPSDQEHARRYARLRYRLVLVEMIGMLGFYAIFYFSGLSHRTASWVSAWTPNPWLQLLGYLAVFGLATELTFLSLHFYSGFLLEHRFGLSRLTVAGWVRREVKQVLVGAGLGLVVCEGFYALLRSTPETWPIWATIGWVGFSVVLSRIFPTVLLPIFYPVTPLHDESLVARLRRLCERVKLKPLGVFRFGLGTETRKANAALAGLGKSRRVLLSDTLLADFTPDEIEGVLGHELGHHHGRHITKFLVLSGIGSFLILWLVASLSPLWLEPLGLTALAQLEGFPILLGVLSLINLLGSPIQHAISRHFEWQADRFAVKLTGSPSTFASALGKLAALNLADPKPPRWAVWLLYDHPPIMDRIQAARRAVRS